MYTFFDSTLNPVPKDTEHYVFTDRKLSISRYTTSICFMPNGFLSVAGGGLIRIFDIEAGIKKKSFIPNYYCEDVSCLTLFPKTSELVFSERNRISIWDYQRDMEYTSWEAHGSFIKYLAISTEGEIASGADENQIYIWDREGRKKRVLSGHGKGIFCLEYLTTGELASSSWDGTIKIWDKNSTECKLTIKTPATRRIKVLPNGTLFCLTPNGQVDIFDANSGECLLNKPSAINPSSVDLAITPAGNIVLCDNGNLTIMDGNGNYLEKLLLPENEDAMIVSISNEDVITCTTHKGSLLTWLPATPQLLFNPQT